MHGAYNVKLNAAISLVRYDRVTCQLINVLCLCISLKRKRNWLLTATSTGRVLHFYT